MVLFKAQDPPRALVIEDIFSWFTRMATPWACPVVAPLWCGLYERRRGFLLASIPYRKAPIVALPLNADTTLHRLPVVTRLTNEWTLFSYYVDFLVTCGSISSEHLLGLEGLLLRTGKMFIESEVTIIARYLFEMSSKVFFAK